MKCLLITGRDALGEGLFRGLAGDCAPVEPVERFSARSVPDGLGAGAVVVYVAGSRGDRHGAEPDLVDADAVFETLAAAGPSHLIVVSSAAVHEPSAHHLQRIEEERVAPRRTGNEIPDAWQALEKIATEGLADVPLTVLRPTPTLVPGGRDFWSRRIRRPLALCVPGYDPTVQLLALDDLVAAIEVVLGAAPETGSPAVYHVAPRSPIPLRAALRRARTVRVPVPAALQAPARALLSPFGLAAPRRQLDWTRYGSTVSDRRIREELGFEPRFSSAEAIDRCRGRRDFDAVDERVVDPAYDPFGLDPVYHRRLSETFFRFLQRRWWRVEYRGLKYIPKAGAAVLAGVHRGFQPWDGVMAMDEIVRHSGRYMRFLVHPSLIKPPVLAPYMLKLGGVPACRANAEWVLDRGGLVGIFPEGIRGAFRPYGPKIYELGKFGRDEYVRFAIRAGAPIVPFVTVGSAEIFPILARLDWPWWRRIVEWPCFPITPTMGLVPLPSKWHTRFLEPVPTAHLGPAAAEDREVVAALSREVRERMRSALDSMLATRRHIFWGSIFDPAPPAVTEPSREGVAAEETP